MDVPTFSDFPTELATKENTGRVLSACGGSDEALLSSKFDARDAFESSMSLSREAE